MSIFSCFFFVAGEANTELGFTSIFSRFGKTFNTEDNQSTKAEQSEEEVVTSLSRQTNMVKCCHLVVNM